METLCRRNGLNLSDPWYEQLFLKSSGAPGAMDAVMNAVFDLFPMPAQPVASIYANVPEGMLFMSNSDGSHKQTLVMSAVLPFTLIAAGAAAGYSTTLERARSAAEKSVPRARLVPREEGKEAPAKAVKNNLQQIAFSAQTWFIDNPKEKEVTYEALVKAELIFDLDAVAGESYKGLTLKRGGGELSVKLKGGDSISLKYKATAD